MTTTLHHGDCLQVLAGMPANSVDSIITDPPYGLGKEPDALEMLRDWLDTGRHTPKSKAGFMGKSWDAFVPQPVVWRECLRVLRPGGHLLAFAGTRTQDLMALSLRIAGFEIRDMVAWVYGQGFPKSLDVSKAIDKRGPLQQAPFAEFAAHYAQRRRASGLTHAQVCAAGGWHGEHNHGGSSTNWERGYGMPTVAQWRILQPLLALDDHWAEGVARVEYERTVIGHREGTRLAVAPGQREERPATEIELTAPGSAAAAQWAGWGTALKPALEPITLARKPLAGTVAANVLQHGTGALNIDGCRVPTDAPRPAREGHRVLPNNTYAEGLRGSRAIDDTTAGRWPANLIHDGSDEVLAAFPQAPGQLADASTSAEGRKNQTVYGAMRRGRGDEPSAATENDGAVGFKMRPGARRLDAGSAARFFWAPKASSAERHEGLEHPGHQFTTGRMPHDAEQVNAKRRGNHHPTVKPVDLMRYLCRLITPPGGVVLDPYMGSGSTMKAAELEGFHGIGIELDAEYVEIARRRIAADAPLFADVKLER